VTAGTRYYYGLTAVDATDFESPPSPTRKGRLVDHALPALVVDATIDGPGGSSPTDARQDAFWSAMLGGVPLAGEWDRADSAAAGVELSDADLGAHRLVVYHADVRTAVVLPDTGALRRYVQQGGKLLLSGSNLAFTLGGSSDLNRVWPPQSFMRSVLKANETHTQNSVDCTGADAVVPGYPNLNVDPVKNFLGRLANQDGYVGPLGDAPPAEAILTYRSVNGPLGENHGRTDAIRILSGPLRLVAFDLPLYFLDSLAVRVAVTKALEDLGEVATSVGAGTAPLHRFGLGAARPNPFRPAATIPFALDRRERVAVRVIDVQGRVLKVLVDGVLDPGTYEASWDGRTAAGRPAGSGVYFAELESGGRRARAKLVLLK
jgi:hypothetical protein